MNPISLAIHGKGFRKAVQRGITLLRRYGVNARKMDRALNQFTNILHRYDCHATFPITSTALQRNPEIIRKYEKQGIEFAIHGYKHWDYSDLTYEEQDDHLNQAILFFQEANVQAKGFRGPYLRWNGDTIAVLREHQLFYDSSQSLAWDVVDEYETSAYQHVLQFYGARNASNYPSLPELDNNVVRLPYSLPDDEAFVERLQLSPAKMGEMWLAILRKTYNLGELFTIGLHPERIAYCQEALEAVLSEAVKLVPKVWVARLDEIATWWKTLRDSHVQVTDLAPNEYHVEVDGPDQLTLLARGVLVDIPTQPWIRSYQQISSTKFIINASKRPFIGLDPGASGKLANFLRQQGYIIEYSTHRDEYAYYFDQPQFVARHKRFLLAQIEGANFPLVRLSRWPDGARSAIAVTGDIDALSIWDYLLRLFGK